MTTREKSFLQFMLVCVLVGSTTELTWLYVFCMIGLLIAGGFFTILD